MRNQNKVLEALFLKTLTNDLYKVVERHQNVVKKVAPRDLRGDGICSFFSRDSWINAFFWRDHCSLL